MKKDILIIEDEPNIAQAQALILEDSFNIHHAEDGEEGFKKAKEIKPDLIILDLMLPKINGYNLCSMIREDKDLKDTKIVMVTARNQDKDEEKGMDMGADDYIMKPFEADELLHVINQVLK
jgi:two-component system alkaline phosphatase synthesis response regulator PhoP